MDKLRLTKTYRQLNLGSAADVFPLLCPVRETEWLDGWNYTMLYSVSGKIEKDCIFSTSRIHLEKNFSCEFEEMMIWWEQSINHFLITGQKLLKEGKQKCTIRKGILIIH